MLLNERGLMVARTLRLRATELGIDEDSPKERLQELVPLLPGEVRDATTMGALMAGVSSEDLLTTMVATYLVLERQDPRRPAN